MSSDEPEMASENISDKKEKIRRKAPIKVSFNFFFFYRIYIVNPLSTNLKSLDLFITIADVSKQYSSVRC